MSRVYIVIAQFYDVDQLKDGYVCTTTSCLVHKLINCKLIVAFPTCHFAESSDTMYVPGNATIKSRLNSHTLYILNPIGCPVYNILTSSTIYSELLYRIHPFK